MAGASAQSEFKVTVAPHLASELGFTAPWKRTKLSRHFAYFSDDDRLLIVIGEESGKSSGLALAYGLTWRDDRALELVLPASHAFATVQRAAWLKAAARPRIHLHDGAHVVGAARVSPTAARQALKDRIPGGSSPAADLRKASQALHLSDCADALGALADWATAHRQLDPSHRQGYRAWHHMGQSVLEIKGGASSATVRAGINDKKGAFGTCNVTVTPARPLSDAALAECKESVENAIEARANGPLRKPDEHWLQAVLRAEPRLAGVEQPALREVPAWRPPPDGATGLNRGYVDLIGLDGNGDIRVVETKLAANDDPLLILQGLDYYTWAQVYAQPLRERLGASDKARIKLCYLIGSSRAGTKVSRYTQAQADAIDPSVEPLYLEIKDWFAPDAVAAEPTVSMLNPAVLPV